MATLVLQTVGSVVGGMVGGPLGAMAGRALGGLAGAAIDNALMSGSEDKVVEGPRLKEIDGLTSTEGAPIPRVYGRARIGGQLIWATRLIEEANTKTERSGSQGRQGDRRRRRKDQDHHIFLLRQSGGRPLRGTDRVYPSRLGGWTRNRSHDAHHAGSSRKRFAIRRSPDRCEGRIDPRTRLSRPCIRGVRTPVACRIRQPRAAILVRSHPARRWSQPHGTRRLPDSRRE